MTRKRDSNLDLLRAIAIIAVLVYHIHGMWPTEYLMAAPFAHLGEYGVTLFFVLSGWLIGGIFWRERDKQGDFSVFNFWIRRWLRTVPPYMAGMVLGYSAVYFARSQPFEMKYLYFGQNYLHEIPYYLISWSLCVEEHFYLCLPLIGALALKMPGRSAAIFLWLLPLLPLVLRLCDPNVQWPAPFGYSRTATHLVAEGLALGTAAAYTSRHFPKQWTLIQKCAKYLSLPAVLVFGSIAFWDVRMEFLLGQSVAALCCSVWLAAIAGRGEIPLAKSQLVYAIAISSYSVYLTHSLAIHVGLRVARTTGSLPSEVLCLAIWLGLIAVTGAAFYFAVERPSIWLRDAISQAVVKNISSPVDSHNQVKQPIDNAGHSGDADPRTMPMDR